LLSASNIRVQLPNGAPSWLFGTPRAMTLTEIRDVQERFAYAANVMEQAGFDGIELHAAHGYLLSQFLSPLANHRTDEYGGTAENRRRMLLETVRAVRARTSARFVVGVKLNSADFQRGGFSEEDSLDVVRALAKERVDFIEVSGGTYESHAMMDGAGALVELRESTRRREAYFLDFAQAARRAAPALPVILTGGFRSRSAMAAAVREGACDLVGLARPLCLDPALPARLAGPAAAAAAEAEVRAPVAWVDGRAGLEALSSFWHTRQLWAIAAGREPRPRMGWLYSQTVQAVRHILLEPSTTPPFSWIWDLLWPVRRPAVAAPAPAAGRGKAE
jgi:2,4-dienoyl-CoA reductase-like NADH-dependent reductase (Old Yellow Enzyme family)